MAIQSAETAQPVEDDQQTTKTDLYDHPEVYAALRAPDPALLAGVRRLIREHLSPSPVAAGARQTVIMRELNGHPARNGNGHGPGAEHLVPGAVDRQVRIEFAPAAFEKGLPSVMDPACGPANWLEPFARDGHRVAGNDLSPHMVAGAKRALAAIGRERAESGDGTGDPAEIGEIIWGDMRDLRFHTGPFDVAIEIAGTTGLLEQPDDLLAHLTTVGEHLRPGGLFLVTVFFDRRPAEGTGNGSLPLLCHESGAIPVRLDGLPDGEARVRYELIAWADDPTAMRMRRTVLTRGVPDCPPRIVEEYGLRTWAEAEVLGLIERTGMYEVLSMEGLPEVEGEDPLGEQTLVLRRL